MRRLLWMFLALGCEPGVTAGDDEEARAALTQAEEARDRCARTEAEPHYLTALAALEARQPGSLAHRGALRRLGQLYRDLARFQEAGQVLEQARALTSENDVEAVKLACATASWHLHQDHPDQAGKVIAGLGPVSDPDARARVLAIRSSIDQAAGRFADAEREAEEALALRRSLPDKFDVLSALNNLGLALQAAGQAERAEKVFAGALNELAAADDIPSTCQREELDLFLVHDLALTYWDQGRTADAAPLYQMVLSDDEARMGPDHPDTAIELFSVALVHLDAGDVDLAAPLLERALAIETRALGETTPRIIATLTALSRVDVWRGDLVRARARLDRAIAIWDGEDGHKSVWGVSAQLDMGRLDVIEGRQAEARAHLEQGLAYAHLNLGLRGSIQAELDALE